MFGTAFAAAIALAGSAHTDAPTQPPTVTTHGFASAGYGLGGHSVALAGYGIGVRSPGVASNGYGIGGAVAV